MPEPLFVYRYWSGQRREDGYAKAKSNASVLRRKWRAYTVKGGEKLMGCRGCGGGGGARAAVNGRTPALTQISQSEITKAKAEESGAIRIEYVGNAEGARTYRGLRSGQVYRFGAAPADKIKLVFAVDAPTFLRLPDFREVRPEPVAVPMAAPTGPVLDMRQAATRVGCASG